MLKYQSKRFMQSALYALNGLRLAFKSQRNFRKHLFISICYILLSIICKISLLALCLVCFTCVMTLAFELINSGIEFIMDAYYKNKWAKLAKLAKDMSAGAVLISSLVSCAITFVLCGEKIFELYF